VPLDCDPLEGLSRLGIDPARLEHVILTHLQYDHADNIGRFEKARFHVQYTEVANATGRCKCNHHLRWLFDVASSTGRTHPLPPCCGLWQE